MNRADAIPMIAARKTLQGFSVDEQYRALNAARDRRKRRRERNLKILLAGGYKQVPLINK